MDGGKADSLSPATIDDTGLPVTSVLIPQCPLILELNGPVMLYAESNLSKSRDYFQIPYWH